MDFTLDQDVAHLQDVPEEGLRAGDVGTVVERHDVAGREPGYSVEFFDLLGGSAAVVTLPASAFRAPTHADRPAVRLQPEVVTTDAPSSSASATYPYPTGVAVHWGHSQC
jgi:hypothetical protein